MKKTISLVLVLVLCLVTKVANADFTFGAPQDLGLGNEGYTYISVSADELELYFNSNRAGGLGYQDIWVSTRQSIDDPWGPPANLQTVNSPYQEGFPCISRDGLTLYFSDFFDGPDRPGGLGKHDLWFSTRASRNDPWGAPVNMGAPFSSLSHEVSPTLSHDGLTFIFASGSVREAVIVAGSNYDLWMCTRPSVQEAWGPPVNMGPSVNSASHDYCGNLSPDGLVLFFESQRSGSYKVWMTKRRTVNDPWEPPVPLPEPMYSMGVGCVSADGSMFYSGMSQVPILPVVDLNGDGIVDSADMCIMVDHWGEDYSLCDIGPTPFGDGIVDVQDLIVLAEHLFEEILPAELVAYWKLDGTEGNIAYNSIGDNHGILSGNPTWKPDSGQVAGALQFDGINDYVETDFVLNPGEGPLSVFARIKGGAPGQVIISQSDGIGTGETWLGMDALGGKFMTGLRPPGGRSPTPPMVSDFVITDGQWHHVGIVVTAHGVRNLYADGMRVAHDTQGVNLPSSDGGIYIGADKDLSTGTFFSGLIDDVRIYDKALNADEIAALAQ